MDEKEITMSCSKWRWTEECDHRPCPGDCDNCGYEETVTGDTYSATQTLNIDTILQIAWETLPEEWFEKLEERLKGL